ncbi:hypothetical protein QBD01_001529 [Ochrobactrum sp. 19YEA23]|uniref:hypothetical protein n=1 Tax=Ochrobactrum sp. 19YEA23 TaxID=3039854 RepID=UPI002478C18B|nr:hypothetical protein [Ochrobactrum sp. 19YEA23]
MREVLSLIQILDNRPPFRFFASRYEELSPLNIAISRDEHLGMLPSVISVTLKDQIFDREHEPSSVCNRKKASELSAFKVWFATMWTINALIASQETYQSMERRPLVLKGFQPSAGEPGTG